MSRKLIAQYRLNGDVDPERCTPIVLADKQTWLFQRAHLVIQPIFRDGKAVSYTKQISCGDELDPLVARIAAGNEDPIAQIQDVQVLGALLLKKSYDVTQEELEKL